MSDECRNDCIGPEPFPRDIDNRPGLSRIDYRIGSYSDIRDVLLRRLDRDTVLARWTHREADDPGIALLEGAAIVGDILTFYQNLYANEAYLRTAQWRESVADLVRLLGYRLTPSMGGRATFAFEIKGDKPVVIPVGFPIRAPLEDLEKTAEFQTTTETIAFPHLSNFHLYCRRKSAQTIGEGCKFLEVDSVFVDRAEEEEARDIGSIQGVDLQPGDRLILIPRGEVLIVKRVEQVLDRSIIEIEGSLTANLSDAVTVYRIGRSFRHFGYNAPAKYTELDDFGLRRSRQKVTDTIFRRQFADTHNRYSILSPSEMPLETSVDDLAVGNLLVCQGGMYNVGTATGVQGYESTSETLGSFTSVCEVKSLRADALSWGNLTGASTIVVLDEPLTKQPFLEGDIRRFQFHEVTSPKLRLRAPTEWKDSLADRSFNFWGTYDEVLTLEGRSLFLQKEGGEPSQVTVTSGSDQFETALAERDRVHPWLWPIDLNKELDAFSVTDFNEDEPLVTVYGNLVDTTEGKTETEAVLGNGDNRQSFQTFKIPKAPLTYLRSEEDNPPFAPELEIYVDDRRWQRMASFFGHGPLDEIYIVREDADCNSWAQFGDGNTGARLPSGYRNVIAIYRSGAGAHGPIKEGATAQAGARLNHLKKVQMPGIATGGEPPEEAETAREAAPGKARGLGRLVGLDDYESEALAAPGVVKAVARWGLHANVPAVLITALMEQGREAEYAELRDILTAADRSRGARRFPIITNPGIRQYVYLGLTFGYNPVFRKAQVLQAVKEALGLSGAEAEGIDGSNGLFSLHQRSIGQPEYATRIEGVVQNVDGVLWARVDNFGPLFGFTFDPVKLIVPKLRERNDVVIGHPLLAKWADQLLLCLHATHLEPVPLAVGSTEVPAHD